MGYVFHFTAMMALSTTLFFMTYAATTEIPATSTSEIQCELVECATDHICIEINGRLKCIPILCTLPKKSGPCEAYMPSYYFNSTSKTCEQFIYGGCGGNANRFAAESDCHDTCDPPGV